MKISNHNKPIPSFPREIADGIFWLGECITTMLDGVPYHVHLGLFLLIGKKRTLLIDTATPRFWPQISKQIETVLGGRKLDLLFPTHPEVPHSSSLPQILDAYPETQVVGDMRDYHVYFPEYQSRFHNSKEGDQLDLGGLKFTFLEAVMKDLPNTLWGYEETQQVMFVSDGFSFTHGVPGLEDHEDPLHRPGQCALTSAELADGVNEDAASFILRAALYWSRFVKPKTIFTDVDRLLDKYPARILAPAHGNVIVNPDDVIPIIRRVHDVAYETAMRAK